MSKLIKSVTGNTIKRIPLSQFREHVEIPYPSKSEQQKIASILSNVDSQIESQIQYKEKLLRLKKSLMQKLLTGEIRVKI
jgi:type I restriction enzyme S subunit